jgi:hypothetical protein
VASEPTSRQGQASAGDRCHDAKLPAGWRSTPRILRTMHKNSRRERSASDQSTGLGAKCSPAARLAVGGWRLAAPGPGALCWVAWVNHTAACPVQVQGGTQQNCQTQRLACPALYLNYLQTRAPLQYPCLDDELFHCRRRSQTVRAGEHLCRRQIYHSMSGKQQSIDMAWLERGKHGESWREYGTEEVQETTTCAVSRLPSGVTLLALQCRLLHVWLGMLHQVGNSTDLVQSF